MPHFYGNGVVEQGRWQSWTAVNYAKRERESLREIAAARVHTGPPTAPNKTASAFFAAVRASSVRGTPCMSTDI
jgi:hypothetical protein